MLPATSFAALLLVGAARPADGPRRLALTSCRPDGAAEQVLCGWLEVPENRAAPAARRIGLNVVVLPALGPERRDPIFELAGGPGVAATSAVGLYTTVLRGYRERRDVVLVDQRGTGGSNALACAVEEKGPLARALREMYPPSYVDRCRAELEVKADLRFYTTSDAVRDLDDVRAALGYERIHLLGISYGTRVAQEYARRHADRVKSLFLFGVLPPWMPVPLHHAAAAQRALDLLLDECAADAACAARYPALRQELRDLVARLRAQPAAVRRDGESGQLTADVFTEAVRGMLYTPAASRALPRIIHAAAAADWRPFLDNVVGDAFPGADGAYLSVTCAEDVPRIDAAEARRITAGTYFGDYRIRQQVRACARWPPGEAPADFGDEVAVSLPVLIYAGYRDPITPPVWADAVAARMPAATVVLVEHEAHMPVGLGNMDCWDRLAVKFFEQGRLDAADLLCVPSMKAPPFE